MFENTTLAASILTNPASIQSLVLTEFENRLGGIYSVADPNNSFNLLLEANSSINAQSVRYMESMFDAQYAVRATTSAELYNNMSDFDYLSMVASPATTTLNLTFNSDYLISNAISYDSVYNLVVIPVGTQFYIGPLTFGIYYPINIYINKITNNIHILWDNSAPNPLHELTTNMIQFIQYSNSGLNLMTLYIPVSQFTTLTNIYPVVQQQGFIQNITYTDQFYSARVFTNTTPGNWTELKYTLSETVYDPTTPTAKLIIQNDTNTITINIPQIYFTNAQIGNQVMVVLYTTTGSINLDLTSVEVASCNCNFGLNQTGVSGYSSILANLSTIDLTPAENVITGGSNAIDFPTLRNLIVNGGLYTSVPITPAELSTYAEKNGFSIVKYIDNITDRIYYASNTITGGQNGYVMTTTATINVILSKLISTDSNSFILPSSNSITTISSIRNFTDMSAITILPTTVYAYNNQTGNCTPINDTEITLLQNLHKNQKSEFVNELNSNIYTRCPFHIVTYTESQYPITKSFNLMNPSVTNIRYIADNVELSPQMSIVNAVVIHQNNGTGGYTLRLGVTKNSTMSQIAESNITVYISSTSHSGESFYGIAQLTGTSGVLSIYELTIPTSYYISQQGNFRSQMLLTSQDTLGTVDISLNSMFNVVFLLNPSLYPTIPQNINLTNYISSQYSQLLGVCQQQIDVVFGTDLSSFIYNQTNALWSPTTYATWPNDVYQTYSHDVYETNTLGGLVYTVDTSTTPPSIKLTKLHSKGDRVLDSSNNPIIQHHQGSVIYDPYGNPKMTVNSNRQLNYYVSSMMFDMRLFYSENPTDVLFCNNLTNTLMSYFNTLTIIQGNLLEQTSFYYKPNSTMGVATFSSGNNTPIVLDLGFSFSFIVYVSQATMSNYTLTTAIVNDIITITQAEMSKSVISLTEITDNIRSQLADTIVSIDVEGIDNTTTLQTVIIPSTNISPIIGQKLVYNQSTGTITLQSDIQVKFMIAD